MRYLNQLFVLYSNVVKALSCIPVPLVLRQSFFKAFGSILLKMNKKDFSEILEPLNSFNCISGFFCREIDLKLRPVSQEALVSPCDGIISECGDINNLEQMIRVKGKPYSLAKLLNNSTLSSKYINGSYIVIYLSPSNYHRFHAPCSGKIEYLKFIPGSCFPVNKIGQVLSKDVYSQNARVILEATKQESKTCMAIVGACAVCGIKVTNKKGDTINKGEEIGMFELGSSIVLILDKKISNTKSLKNKTVKARGSILN